MEGRQCGVAIGRFLLDLLFPIECLGCGQDDTFLCVVCASGVVAPEALARLNFVPQNLGGLCVFCGAKSVAGKPCLKCVKNHALDRVLVAASYASELVRNAIYALKYGGVKGLAKPLGALMVRSIFGSPTSKRELQHINFLVIPLPLHPKRFKTRGYNQAELLAREVATSLNLPLCTDVLVRTRATAQQVGLTGAERCANLKNAFTVNTLTPNPLPQGEGVGEGVSLAGKTILLIDDVTTTGTTLDEAAKVLKKAGATQVWGMVVARG